MWGILGKLGGNLAPGIKVSSVQSLSHVRLFVTPWTAAHHATLSLTISQSLLKLESIDSLIPSNHLILCCPLLLPPSIFPGIRVFSDESVLRIRWPKYWSFSFSISPSKEYSGLISFRMDWLDLLAVQGTLKSLLQHHSLKASILLRSAFFIAQLSHPHMTTGIQSQPYKDAQTMTEREERGLGSAHRGGSSREHFSYKQSYQTHSAPSVLYHFDRVD